jgi:hypothetical protein
VESKAPPDNIRGRFAFHLLFFVIIALVDDDQEAKQLAY